MYLLEQFRLNEEEAWKPFSERSFASLALQKSSGELLCSHLSYLCYEKDENWSVELHPANSNPIAEPLSKGYDCLLVGQMEAYSPSWHEPKDQVPTWLSITIELHGRSSVLPSKKTVKHLVRLISRFETVSESSCNQSDLPKGKL